MARAGEDEEEHQLACHREQLILDRLVRPLDQCEGKDGEAVRTVGRTHRLAKQKDAMVNPNANTNADTDA